MGPMDIRVGAGVNQIVHKYTQRDVQMSRDILFEEVVACKYFVVLENCSLCP